MNLLLLAAAALASAVYGVPELEVLRPAVVLPFATVVPGYAWARVARVGSPLVELVVGVLLSLALVTLLALGLLALGEWSPGVVLAGLVVLTVVAVLARVRQQRRAP